METIQRFFRHALLSYKALFGMMDPKTYSLFMVFNPIMQMLFFGFLVNYIYEGKDLSGYIASNALLLCVLSSVFGMMSVVMNDRGNGTLPIVIASPANKGLLFIARTMPHVINGFITSIIGLVVGMLIFDLTISLVQFALLMSIWVVSIMAACSLGLILGACSFWTPSMHLLSNILSSLLLVLSGANYSLTILPGYLQDLAHAFPLMRGVELTKQLLNEGDTSQILPLLTQELALGCLYLVIGIWLVNRAESIARKAGTLELSQ
jgi:ABC-2 type transport system permease protein